MSLLSPSHLQRREWSQVDGWCGGERMQKHLVCVRYTTGSVCTSDSEKYERYRLKDTVRVFLQRFSETKLLQGSGWSHLKWLGSYVGVSVWHQGNALRSMSPSPHNSWLLLFFRRDNKNEEFFAKVLWNKTFATDIEITKPSRRWLKTSALKVKLFISTLWSSTGFVLVLGFFVSTWQLKKSCYNN